MCFTHVDVWVGSVFFFWLKRYINHGSSNTGPDSLTGEVSDTVYVRIKDLPTES